MEENERKQLALISGLLLKVLTNREVTDNDIISLENVVSELGYFDIKEKEFRW